MELEVLAAAIRDDIEAADGHWQNAVKHAIRAGEGLMEAKGRLDHGQWLPWLKANVSGVSERSAQRYMQLAQNRHTVADLPSVRAALALIAPPRQPAHPVVDAELSASPRPAVDGPAPPEPTATHPAAFEERAPAPAAPTIAQARKLAREVVRYHDDYERSWDLPQVLRIEAQAIDCPDGDYAGAILTLVREREYSTAKELARQAVYHNGLEVGFALGGDGLESDNRVLGFVVALIDLADYEEEG